MATISWSLDRIWVRLLPNLTVLGTILRHIRPVWSRHGYVRSTSPRQNKNHGPIPNWPVLPPKRIKMGRLGIKVNDDLVYEKTLGTDSQTPVLCFSELTELDNSCMFYLLELAVFAPFSSTFALHLTSSMLVFFNHNGKTLRL